MVIYKAKDYQDMSRKAANIISAQIIMKPNCVLGLATGSSPVGTYKQLIEWYNTSFKIAALSSPLTTTRIFFACMIFLIPIV